MTVADGIAESGVVVTGERLAATYGHRGLVVHCICPQGVRAGEPGKWLRGMNRMQQRIEEEEARS